MKRLITLLLSLTLTAALLVPPVLAEVLPESGTASQEQPESADVQTADSAETQQDAENGGAAEPESTVEGQAAASAVTGAFAEDWEALDTVPKDPDEAELIHLKFSDLQSVLEKNNLNIRYMKESLDDLKTIGSHNLDYAIGGMGNINKKLQEALALAEAGMGTDNEEMHDIYEALYWALQASASSVASQIGSLEGQASSLDVTTKTSRNSLEDGMNQLYKGAETLYVAILTLEKSAGDVERTIATLDRAIAIYEKQNELGMASDYDVETMRYNRVTAASGLESLRYSIRTCKVNLEAMCGYPLTGTVVLEPVAMPSPEELQNVSYDKNLNTAMKKNVDVANAYAKWDDDDDNDGTSENDSAEANYDAACASFRSGYKLICMAVPEKERLLNTAQATVDFQERTFSIAAKKYELGMLSYEEYQSAQNELDKAKSDLFSAQMELFTAYRDYVWATTCGIV